MAKLKLQPNPTFKAKVDIHVPGEKPAQVTFTFKYRSRKKLEEFLKEVLAMDDVEMIQAMTEGWDLEDEFSADNITILVDAYISAPTAIFEVYTKESTGARAKN